ncbi:MAG: hypothetical protein EBY30_11290, partial [Rhodospirillales bacterium]|nr:hypothetical protein [Rhodospirillales bacterium]
MGWDGTPGFCALERWGQGKGAGKPRYPQVLLSHKIYYGKYRPVDMSGKTSGHRALMETPSMVMQAVA